MYWCQTNKARQYYNIRSGRLDKRDKRERVSGQFLIEYEKKMREPGSKKKMREGKRMSEEGMRA
jgi:hypothetical protein